MKNLTPDEEAAFVDSVLDAVKLAKEGTDITDAVEKVARDKQYGPPFIKRLTEAFNKARHVHMTNQAGADKTASFPVVDAQEIIKRIYPQEFNKKASFDKTEVPDNILLKLDIAMQKQAADEEENEESLTHKEAARLVRNYENLYKKITQRLAKESSDCYQEMMDNIQRTVGAYRYIRDDRLEKTARTIVNAYPRFGKKMINLLNTKVNRKLPVVEKSANSAVLPPTEFFNSLDDLYRSAQKYASAEAGQKLLEKESVMGLLGDVTAHKLFQRANSKGDLEGRATPGDVDIVKILTMDPQHSFKSQSMQTKDLMDDVVLPEVANKLKTLERKSDFFNTILYDPKFKGYPYKDLTKAYQNVMQISPNVSNKPLVLGNLMLRQLDTGGVMDPTEAKQLGEISKIFQDTEKGKLEMEQLKQEMSTDRKKQYKQQYGVEEDYTKDRLTKAEKFKAEKEKEKEEKDKEEKAEKEEKDKEEKAEKEREKEIKELEQKQQKDRKAALNFFKKQMEYYRKIGDRSNELVAQANYEKALKKMTPNISAIF